MSVDGLCLTRQRVSRSTILVLAWGVPRRLSLTAVLDGCPPRSKSAVNRHTGICLLPSRQVGRGAVLRRMGVRALSHSLIRDVVVVIVLVVVVVVLALAVLLCPRWNCGLQLGLDFDDYLIPL